ncbi:MAG: hypothetical protein CL885_04620 [Dehalococcoidia bacterium]|nr:hypothetical protein [Dehalococcoidia bacterium]|tara:strand:- start:62 stop:886 length:825 start_codon:yes stop_codon:yes gene_type:complete
MNDTTKEILTEMLTESTGKSILDSGDHYGRHWEKNKKLAGDNPVSYFESLPASTLRFSHYRNRVDIEVTHNVFHWLAERLRYSDEMQSAFEKFSEESNEHYLHDMETFAKEMDSDCFTCNTYNGEDLLSQTIQYVSFDSDFYDEKNDIDLRGTYVALQIHNGCDVRGGYTSPKLFEVINEYKYALADNARATIFAPNSLDPNQMTIPETGVIQDNSHYWDTDNGCNFYSEELSVPSLEDFEASEEIKDKGNGFIFIDGDGNGYSPLNGKLLEVI